MHYLEGKNEREIELFSSSPKTLMSVIFFKRQVVRCWVRQIKYSSLLNDRNVNFIIRTMIQSTFRWHNISIDYGREINSIRFTNLYAKVPSNQPFFDIS